VALKFALAVSASLVLSGCAGTRGQPAPESDSLPSAPAVPRAPGAYYKDDGPGANPPADLGSVPDAVPKLEPLHRFANRPYQVFGQAYTPLVALQPFKQRGRASWYGRRFHGNKTSSGERYDMYAMTAAHPTLPIPSYVRVTSLENGRSVVVRINDRGPFHAGRIIDLSYTAAYKLGFVTSGGAEVQVEAMLPWQPAQQAGTVYLQLGAFSTREGAESFRTLLAQQLAWLEEAVQVLALGPLWRLHLGPYTSSEQARGVAERIEAELRIRPFVVVR
jgi:rare lipoprotein A